ncbi:hypothetical protein PR202_gb09918 [Eleusine coracana subsp. coracana]|uniref:Uncharacterized protein n=1 Tax=Eleusine coracana subsp. coracana TaxID=191504 RepID=A0AAV5EIL7_ELECO|nr:hypothetical protein PR202_gb09918 [Eleusine coracana subsp. coracana]
MLDSSSATYAAEPPAVTNPFAASDDDTAAGGNNPFLATAATAPPSPNPFEHGASSSDADPFDLFQHFTSAPASPTRAAAIYAQFDVVDDDDVDGGDGFQPRVSYSTVTSTVPFEWEERPGKPKPEFTADADDDADADFDFGVLLDKAAQARELTTADELFDEGKIRPLKPPPRLLEGGGGGSVGSSPRSARSMIWSPRLRGTRGRSAAAALEKAAMAPSPLGVGSKNDDDGDVNNESASSPMNPADPVTSAASTAPPAANKNSNGGGRKKWRLSDLLLFRRASSTKGRAGGNISRDPVFKYAPMQQQLGTTGKEDANNAGSVAATNHKKQSKKAAASSTTAEGGTPTTPHKQSVIGCVRLHPGLHRLAKGFNGHSVHLGGRGSARSAMKG